MNSFRARRRQYGNFAKRIREPQCLGARFCTTHSFHEVARGSNVGIYDLRSDHTASRIADTIWRDFDGEKLEGERPNAPRETYAIRL